MQSETRPSVQTALREHPPAGRGAAAHRRASALSRTPRAGGTGAAAGRRRRRRASRSRRRRAPRRPCPGRDTGEQVLEARAQRGILDRHQRLHAQVEVARHQVGRADPVLEAARRRAEAEDARVLEEAAEHRAHADPLRQPRARPGAGSRCCARTRSISAPARRRRVERVDDRGVGQVVQLDRRCGRRARASRSIRSQHASAQRLGRHQQLLVAARAAAAGQPLEQLRHVAASRARGW